MAAHFLFQLVCNQCAYPARVVRPVGVGRSQVQTFISNGGLTMEKSLTFADNESFYKQLIELEARHEEYLIDTGIMDAKKLPLRLLHHVGLTKDEIAHVQHKV